MLKFLLKKIFNKLLTKQEKILSNLYNSINNNKNPLILFDIGGSGGLQERWKLFEKKIEIIFVEPDKRSSLELKQKGFKVIEKGLWKEKDVKKFYLTKKAQTSSIYKPNKDLLNLFPDSSRFDIVKEINIEVDKLDNCIDKKYLPHFIKLDTQGSELAILKGGNDTLQNVLGLEIEVNFKKIYQNIPSVHEIETFLLEKNFVFIDFISFFRWERDGYRGFGELVHADALFLKSPENIIKQFKDFKDPISVYENYTKILFIYNKLDLIKIFSKLINDEQRKLLNLNTIIKNLEKKHKRLIFLNRFVYSFTRYFISKNSIFHHWNL